MHDAHSAGCPRNQVENFLRAGIVLQPRQLQASAMARLCDEPGGPTHSGYGGEDGIGGDNAADALRYLVSTRKRSISERKLQGV